MWAEVFKRSVGRPKKYGSAEELAEIAAEYFTWVDSNPFKKDKVFSYQGETNNGTEAVQRPYTLTAFCIYAGISDETFRNYDSEEDLKEICQAIRDVITNQKLEGATSNLFNASIVARELGLADKQQVDHSSRDGTMTPTDPEKLREELAKLGFSKPSGQLEEKIDD